MRDRLLISDRKLNDLIVRTDDYSDMMNALRTDLHGKESMIVHLQTTNQELEQFIRDSRQSRPPNPLDQSVECLDSSTLFASMSPTTSFQDQPPNHGRSPSQHSTPESLARTVVDIQLREQQALNERLTEQLAQFETINAELREKIASTTEEHTRQMNELQQQLTEANRLAAANQMCADKHADEVARLNADVERVQCEQNALEAAAKQLQNTVAINESRIQELAAEAQKSKCLNDDLFAQVSRLNAVNRDLLQQNADKDVQLDELTGQHFDLKSARSKLEDKLADMKAMSNDLQSNIDEHEQVKLAMTAEMKRLKETITHMAGKIDLLERLRDSMQVDGEKSRQHIRTVEESLSMMRQQKSDLEDKVDGIQREMVLLQESLR